MWPYYLLVGIPAMLGIINLRNAEKRRKSVILSFFLIWILLLCLRNETVGADIRNYNFYFNYYGNCDLSQVLFRNNRDIEIGFILLIRLFSFLHCDFRAFLIFIAIVSVLPLLFLYKQNVKSNPYLAVILLLNIGIFAMYFSGLRQILSMAFLYPAYNYSREKKFLRFIISVVFAMLFHKSAIVMVLLYPTLNYRIKRLNLAILGGTILAFSFIFRKQVFSICARFISNYYEANVTNTGAFSFLIMLILFAIYAVCAISTKSITDDMRGLLNNLFLCIYIQIFASTHFLAMRANYYFLPLVPMFIADVERVADEKNRIFVLIANGAMTVFFVFFYFYKASTMKSIIGIYPYRFLWS